MKTYRWAAGLALMVFTALFVFLGNQSCTNNVPTNSTFVATATATLQPNVIDNLEDGDIYLNPSMCGVGSTGVPNGFWIASTWGGNTINSPFIICGGVGANGTSCAAHLFGNVVDKNDQQFPSFQLEAILNGRKPFDTTVYGYHGVKFFIKVGMDDTCIYRRFSVPIVQIQPPEYGGTCPSNCYGNFGTSLTATNGLWVQKTYYFDSSFGTPFLARIYGNAIVPTTFTGVNLQQLLELEWQFGRNGTAGTSAVDYWVDEVEFF